ncbi:MAG: hypothetical protein PUH54_01160 [Oscillospiraceae bacterium]|nr:hypothetical protein [Oscillospiraceae bacterium]
MNTYYFNSNSSSEKENLIKKLETIISDSITRQINAVNNNFVKAEKHIT